MMSYMLCNILAAQIILKRAKMGRSSRNTQNRNLKAYMSKQAKARENQKTMLSEKTYHCLNGRSHNFQKMQGQFWCMMKRQELRLVRYEKKQALTQQY